MKYTNNNGEHIKTIPKRYGEVENLESLFIDLSKKRLTPEERQNIELHIFINELGDHNVKELISDKEFTHAESVCVRNDQDYFVGVFDGVKVKCKSALFYSSILRKEVFISK